MLKYNELLKSGLVIGLLFITLFVNAQDEEYVSGDVETTTNTLPKKKGFDWNRTTIGGGFYASFGRNPSFLIAPTFGYYLTDNFVVGFGLKYAYDKIVTVSYPYKSNTYGGNIYTQYVFKKLPFLVHAEIEYANIVVDYESDNIEDLSLNIINPYIGGGIKQQIGNYSYFYALVLYNLNETKESNLLSTNPVLRIGISIGL